MNSSLCGIVESGYDAAGGVGWGSAGSDNGTDTLFSAHESSLSADGAQGSSTNHDSLLIGAWRGAPDGVGADRRGGYFTGFLDNFEVLGLACDMRLPTLKYRPCFKT